MKAVAKLKPEPGAMALIDLPEPVRKPGEVLIRIAAGGICGTDVAIWKWHEAVVGQYAPSFPLIVGHEFAGTVVETDSARAPLGAVVAVNPQIACGHCRYCGLGRPTLCDDRRLMGGRINGGWTEYVSVPAWNVFALPTDMDPAVAPLLEPLSVATHAVLERVPVRTGDVVAVIGAGPIGILCAILSLAAGAREVLVTGVTADEGRLRMARDLGAVTVNVEAQDPLLSLRALQADGADIVYETSGVAATLEQAIAMTRRGGSVGLIGLCQGASTLKSTPVVLKELALVGSRGYNETTWALTMTVLPRVAKDVMRLVTHQVAYKDFEQALQLVERREGSKIVLRP
ncbi:alcohol dehydrogenase catalytic domain-containing protein [Hydrogenophaga sp.]|uniref:zinc-dependent alcohol dehydrogenase n=1 Tax=Hydrogenophaga sp. TaxID=1904254 RepID=UPI002612A4B8|nr:alcohol dehydrogenase catalytic domain-containing protein [Hydrogenophaga sp.]MCW5654569.1 alcohol dehydrogenase catalytic domain-containing protein [Hydrogenophaga sp.]